MTHPTENIRLCFLEKAKIINNKKTRAEQNLS